MITEIPIADAEAMTTKLLHHLDRVQWARARKSIVRFRKEAEKDVTFLRFTLSKGRKVSLPELFAYLREGKQSRKNTINKYLFQRDKNYGWGGFLSRQWFYEWESYIKINDQYSYVATMVRHIAKAKELDATTVKFTATDAKNMGW